MKNIIVHLNTERNYKPDWLAITCGSNLFTKNTSYWRDRSINTTKAILDHDINPILIQVLQYAQLDVKSSQNMTYELIVNPLFWYNTRFVLYTYIFIVVDTPNYTGPHQFKINPQNEHMIYWNASLIKPKYCSYSTTLINAELVKFIYIICRIRREYRSFMCVSCKVFLFIWLWFVVETIQIFTQFSLWNIVLLLILILTTYL